MMFTWIDGHLVLALMAIPICSVWAVGFINWVIRFRATRGGAR